MGQSLWKREQDLNLRLPAYEAGELPDCSTPLQALYCFYRLLATHLDHCREQMQKRVR